MQHSSCDSKQIQPTTQRLMMMKYSHYHSCLGVMYPRFLTTKLFTSKMAMHHWYVWKVQDTAGHLMNTTGYCRNTAGCHMIPQECCKTHKILNNEYPASLYLVAFRHTAHHYVMEVTHHFQSCEQYAIRMATGPTKCHTSCTDWETANPNPNPQSVRYFAIWTVTFNACTDPYR